MLEDAEVAGAGRHEVEPLPISEGVRMGGKGENMKEGLT